ncbi:MAG: uracil-DNA glycosylase family protein [Thermoflexales bacterium]
MPSKASKYIALVSARKVCTECHSSGLTNPACVRNGALDSGEIGPWTRWNGDLNARLVVVGQEWGDIASFERQGGIDTPSPTNEMLRELLASVGVSILRAPGCAQSSGVFLTNAALCLKIGGAQAPVKQEWFDNCGASFLRAQIELVQPRVVVTLGERAYRAVRDAFALPNASFHRAANRGHPMSLPISSLLVPVYHCGQRILNTHRKREAQFQDWLLVKALLASSPDA